VTVRATVADPGEGGDIQITTIVNKALGIPREKIRYDGRDTARAPHSGPSAGSRQTTLTGKAIANACAELKKTMQENGCKTYEEMITGNLPTHYVGKHLCKTTDTDAKTGHGRPYENRAYIAQMVEIEVDTRTGKTKVIKMTAVGDIGTILNPLAVEGQFEGGLNMGLGYGLWEDYKHPETNTLIKGGIPNFINSPLTETHFNQTYRPNGTFGATGCGEIVMVPTAAAVANAIEDAVGARVTHLPISPDKIASAMKK
jgi:aldehyde oxidoreductase